MLKAIDPKEVVVDEDRARKNFNRQDLFKLEESIQRLGQLQPGVCTMGSDGLVHLVAGERRLRACTKLSIPYHYILKEDIKDPVKLKEIELEENLCRADLTWQEEVQAKADLHELKQALYGTPTPGRAGGHTLADTAEELGETKGLISKDIELAMWAKELDEVAQAKTKTEAKKIVQRIKEQLEREDLLKDAVEKAQEPSKALEDHIAEELTVTSTEDAPIRSVLELKILEFDKRILHGKIEDELTKFKDGSIDIILFDPPWAVGFDQVKMTTGSTKDYPDDVQENLANFPKWLQLIYAKMAPNSHLYMFFGIVNHQLIYNTLEAIGFVTNRMPIIWHKQGIHHTRNPKVWPGRSYEPIAFARKGSKDLVIQGLSDVVTTNPPTAHIKSIHPSAKHPDIYINLIERSAKPGDVVVDPMCGSGMSLVACEHLTPSLKLDYWGIEQDVDFRNLGVYNLSRGYHQIVLVNPIDTRSEEQRPISETLPEDFKELEPGTTDWKRYWKTHPEKQDEMLAFAKNIKVRET